MVLVQSPVLLGKEECGLFAHPSIFAHLTDMYKAECLPMEASESWFRLSFEYRVLYYFNLFPLEPFTAYQGACWCSDDRIGSFPYGPGPDDPSLPSHVLKRFLLEHRCLLWEKNPVGRKMELSDEQMLNRHCLLLGQFEMIMRRGLYDCYDLPIFSRPVRNVDDLLNTIPQHFINRMTHLSYNYYFNHKEYEIDLSRLLRRKKEFSLSIA